MIKTVVFCLKVHHERSYSEIADFIDKREHQNNITQKETKRVLHKFYLENRSYTSKEWVRKIAEDIAGFREIKEPHKIKNLTDEYNVLYCICVDKQSDIIDLSNLYLIKHHYSDLNIIIWFPECDDARYFTVSQFLYSIAASDKEFYNACYFSYRGYFQRAQINNVTFSRSFTPLQVIDIENVKRLFRKCKGLIKKAVYHPVSYRTEADEEGYDDLLQGAVKILKEEQKSFSGLLQGKYLDILEKLDILAFVLLCYVICGEKRELSLPLLKRYAFQMQQYSTAIRQLAENIVFHSKTGTGVIACRLHDKKSQYINEKYNIEDTSDCFLEIIVSDFCRDNSSCNISDSFISHLKDKKMRAAFAELKPRTFFDHGQDMQKAWELFYRNPDHIGRHFGLRIFQSVVSAYGGIFGAESHCGYRNMPGDTFLPYEETEESACMPGTRYHIVFPIENIRKVTKQDLSLDSGINLGTRIRDYLSYTVREIIFDGKWELPQTQQQKNGQIRHLADELQRKMEEQNKDIIYISLEKIPDNKGEIIAKALTIALFHFKKDAVLVLYQCLENLKKDILDTMRIFFLDAEIEAMFDQRKVQLVLYSENFEETVLDLSSIRKTDSIQAYISHMKCIVPKEGYLDADSDNIDLETGAAEYIPCDVLFEVTIHDKTQTLFEHYTESILKNSIQKSEFGCRLEHTHMRLGSTIHIDNFYEAEILFGNKLFISRFALLLVKDMKEDIKDIPKLTLYGYGTYSEAVLVQMIEMIGGLYPEKRNVDYIILEREEERRGFMHKDRIRYNRYFRSKEERADYFRDRKIAIIVLINSTLKTHMRLINLFREENEIDPRDYQWIVRNYAAILVGNASQNKYWSLKRNKSIEMKSRKITPAPQYFLQVDADYQEPAECQQCFPENPVAEIPLIEVNAASTIPNQAFGIVEDSSREKYILKYSMIEEEENKLQCLKAEFIYGHVHRNENHFLYYFRTENICTKHKESIRSSLKEWKVEHWMDDFLQYNVIVAPMHFSNAGFVELVNNVVFGGNAILLRVDFDKEYRCNAFTKYSYLRNYVEQLKSMDFKGTVRVHYVDDVIISGRTYQRARSLMHSVFGISGSSQDDVGIKVFDKVFVLVDRNSEESRRQYVTDSESDFYAFVTVKISSLRNYGDSCVYCNLKKEADLLYDIASTKLIADYWKHCAEKFQLYSLEQYNEKHRTVDYGKQFRRLFCTHMAQCVLAQSHHGNNNTEVIYLILKLLNVDYEFRKEDRYEYFLSYLKCISRPFLVFQKPVKEAIFDIMLVLIDAIVCGKKLREVIRGVEQEKSYLSEKRLIEQFNKLNGNILQNLSEDNRKDLVKLLMKQLTELKSNYIIRPAKMDALFAFMEKGYGEGFEKDYITWIDRLVGASSDTNKSVWLDESIKKSRLEHVPDYFRAWILIENTRAFKDGIEKLYKRIYEEGSASLEFGKLADERIRELEKQYDYRRVWKMFSDFETKYAAELEKYHDASDLDSEIIQNMKKRIQRFLKSLPELEKVSISGLINSLIQTTNNWSEIFFAVRDNIVEECSEWDSCQKVNGTQAGLLERIEEESDMYQFASFYKLLREEQEEYFNGQQLFAEGADMLICCVKILFLCRNKKPELLAKVQLLAMLFKVILRAQRVQFIIENRAGANLDAWKHNIEKRYNAIVAGIHDQDPNGEVETISIKGKRHYSIIVEKSGGGDYNTEVAEATEKLIEELEHETDKRPNYVIDKAHGVVLWKLENDQRSIWINMENDEWCSEEQGYEVKIARRIRKVLMFYQELRKGIFNPENDDYINEISHARKELSIYNSDKVYTHTKDHAKEAFFEHAQHYFGNEDNKKYLEDYPSYILKLLTDINLSQYYRYGMKENRYYDERGFKETAKWGDFAGLITDQVEYKYCVDKKETIKIRLHVSDIDDKEEILCRTSASSVRETAMLIYALILNAAEQNRGKRKILEKSSIQSGLKSVIVNIYCAQGDLVIENECESEVNLQQIKRKLQCVPDSEEDGISLWSLNCYIRQCINSMILAKLKEIESNIQESSVHIKEIRDTGIWIKKLTEPEYEIRPESYQEQGRYYFRVRVPIFMKKFRQGKEKNSDEEYCGSGR